MFRILVTSSLRNRLFVLTAAIILIAYGSFLHAGDFVARRMRFRQPVSNFSA
jgi:hypothetical protein